MALLALGTALLVAGARALVTGASGLAVAAGISPLAVGLTVVAFASSAPELAVTAGAAFTGRTGVALGNVVGSNIFNVLVVLGLASLAAPLSVSDRLVRLDMPVLIAISLLVLVLSLDGRVSPAEGLLLLAGLAGYTFFQIRQGRKEGAPAAGLDGPRRTERNREGRSERGGWLKYTGLVAGGAVVVALGARCLVAAAVAAANALGVSELVTGLTLVAAGSSLPEGVTTILAARRGEKDMAVGNIVGSNLFNLLAVLGVGSLAAPGGLAVPPGALTFDLPIMIGVVAAAFPIFLTGFTIGRLEGLVFLSYYVAYIIFLFLRATRHDTLPAWKIAFGFFVLPLTAFMLAVVALRAVGRTRDGDPRSPRRKRPFAEGSP